MFALNCKLLKTKTYIPMSKIKLPLTFILFSFLFVTPCNAQDQLLEKKISEIDSIVYTHQGRIAIPMIDSLLKKKLPIDTELHLKAFKLEALVQVGKYESALILSKEIIKNPDLKGVPLIRTYIETALLYEISEEFIESKKFLDFVANYYENPEVAKDELYGEYLYRLSSWYKVQLFDQKGDEYAEKARAFGNAHNFENVEATALMILSSSRVDTKKFFSEKSIQNFKRALMLWKKHNNYYHMENMYSSLSTNFKEKKDYKTAHAYVDSAIYASRKVKYYIGLASHLSGKSKIYERQGNLKKSLFYLKKYKAVLDSSSIYEQALKVSEINAKFNYEKESLKNEALEQNLTNEKEQKSNLLIGLIVLVVLLGSLVFLALNLTKRRKEIKSKNVSLTEALDKNKLLLRELNHRVNNNLALILSLVKFQYYEIDEPKYKDKFQSLEHRIKTIAAAHEQLLYNKENIEGEDYHVQEYLSKITNALINISTKNVQLNLDAKDINLNIDTMLPIGILINELMSNSLKHAVFKDVLIIDVQVSLQQSDIFITYKDSGTSFKETKNKKSLGVSIINSMVKQLRGTIERVNSEYTISLQLKNSEK